MKLCHLLPVMIGAFLLLSACQPTAKDQIMTLEAEYAEILNADAGNLDRQKLSDVSDALSKAYLDYADRHPEDPQSVGYMFKAAELKEAQGNDFQGALGIYDRIFAAYPEDPKAADALFRKAYIQHNLIRDIPAAERAYRTFLERYPDHELATSAEFELENLGLTPEELFERMKADSAMVDSLPS